MKTLTFHPIDLGFFDGTIGSLFAGRKIDPEPFVADAIRFRKICAEARRYPRALESILSAARPPEPDSGSGWWVKVRSRLDALAWRPDELQARVLKAVDPAVHLHGRPFFVAETSAERVADSVDAYLAAASPAAAEALARTQLSRLDPELAERIEPEDGPPLSSELAYRSDLLAALTAVHEVGWSTRQTAASTDAWAADRSRTPAKRGVEELPWRAVVLHSRIYPFWTAEGDVLDAVSRAAGVPPPEVVVRAVRPFAEACRLAPELESQLRLELPASRGVAGFVAPSDVPALVDILRDRGALIIKEATKQGEGPACSALLRAVRECATWAGRRGFGLLEATAVGAPDLED